MPAGRDRLLRGEGSTTDRPDKWRQIRPSPRVHSEGREEGSTSDFRTPVGTPSKRDGSTRKGNPDPRKIEIRNIKAAITMSRSEHGAWPGKRVGARWRPHPFNEAMIVATTSDVSSPGYRTPSSSSRRAVSRASISFGEARRGPALEPSQNAILEHGARRRCSHLIKKLGDLDASGDEHGGPECQLGLSPNPMGTSRPLRAGGSPALARKYSGCDSRSGISCGRSRASVSRAKRRATSSKLFSKSFI